MVMANMEYWHSSQVALEIIPIRRNLALVQADTYNFPNGHRYKKYSIVDRRDESSIFD